MGFEKERDMTTPIDVFQHNEQIIPGRGGGGYSSKLSVGVCRPVLQILTQFQTKTCQNMPFSTPVFRPGL